MMKLQEKELGGGGVGGVKALQVKLGTHFSVWGVDF